MGLRCLASSPTFPAQRDAFSMWLYVSALTVVLSVRYNIPPHSLPHSLFFFFKRLLRSSSDSLCKWNTQGHVSGVRTGLRVWGHYKTMPESRVTSKVPSKQKRNNVNRINCGMQGRNSPNCKFSTIKFNELFIKISTKLIIALKIYTNFP